MATFWPQPIVVTFEAAADLTGSQFRFVKLDSAGKVVAVAAITDIPVGVLQNNPASGQAAEVVVLGGTKLRAAAAIALPALIGVDTAGKGKKIAAGTDGTQYIVGQADEAAGGADELVSAFVNCINPARAV